MTDDHGRAADARARRAAKRAGMSAQRSRWRAGSIDNLGELMLVGPIRNRVIAGPRFNMTADEVIAFRAEAHKEKR